MPRTIVLRLLAPSIGAALLLTTSSSAADIYKYVDQNGVTNFSDRRLNSAYKLVLRTSKTRASPQTSALYVKNRRRFAPIIEQLAQRYRLDSALVHAVVTAESAYNPEAVSRKGAVGLMQLMPDTARRYGVSDRRNPTQNVTGGIRYLRDLLLQFRSVTLALAAYNAGENSVVRHGNRIPPFPETQQYVVKVLAHYKQLKKAHASTSL